MKFTSEDLIKAMGLAIGDKIKVNNRNIFKVISETTIQSIETKVPTDIIYIIDQDFEILPKPKRVGNLGIDDKDIYYKYKLVPLLDYKSNLCDWGIGVSEPKNLYEVLEHWQRYNKDQEIYDLLKARLDKEVSE